MNIILPIVLALMFPYLLAIMLIFRGWKRLKPIQSFTFRPKVSIVVAARNEEKNLRQLLKDLQAQDYPSELLEIIVADDHSEDATALVAKNLPGVKLVSPREVQQGFVGKKQALRAAASLASGEILLFTDADCRVKPGWVKAMVSAFENLDLQMVAGPVHMLGKGLRGSFFELEFLSLSISTAGSIGAGFPLMCNGANLAFRRTTWHYLVQHMPGQALASGDDVFMMMTLIKEKGISALTWCMAQEAIVHTAAPTGLREFFAQRIRWASKTGHYSYLPSKIVAWVVLFTNLIFFLSMGLLPFGFFQPFLWIFLSKSILDFMLLWDAARFFHRRSLLVVFLPAQVLYPIYIAALAIGALITKPTWKGRPIR
ncbi:MAG: glycosyltransferase [Bacteroidales bacterium]